MASGVKPGFSGYIIMKHYLSNNSYILSVYGHLQTKNLPAKGSYFKKGEFIASIASVAEMKKWTGFGPHLHFEIRKSKEDTGYNDEYLNDGYDLDSSGRYYDPTDVVTLNWENGNPVESDENKEIGYVESVECVIGYGAGAHTPSKLSGFWAGFGIKNNCKQSKIIQNVAISFHDIKTGDFIQTCYKRGDGYELSPEGSTYIGKQYCNKTPTVTFGEYSLVYKVKYNDLWKSVLKKNITILQSQSSGDLSAAYLDGAGSVIRTTKTDGEWDNPCWGCNKDQANMQIHPSPSTVVFQWVTSTSCTHLDIGILSSEEYRNQHPDEYINPNIPLDVNIHAKEWDDFEVQTSYRTTLPVTVKSEGSWNTIAITSQKSISKVKEIVAQCSTSPMISSTIHELNEKKANLVDGYIWAGNSSIIRYSNLEFNRQDAIYQDVAVGSDENKAITLFQWQPSLKCSTLKLKSGQYPDGNGDSASVISVNIKGWSEKNWGSNKCNGKLPCSISVGSDAIGHYYIVRVKTKANALDGDRISAVCSE